MHKFTDLKKKKKNFYKQRHLMEDTVNLAVVVFILQLSTELALVKLKVRTVFTHLR